MRYSVYVADKTTLDALHVDSDDIKSRLEDLYEVMDTTWGQKPMYPPTDNSSDDD